jgi:hypothetical protein
MRTLFDVSTRSAHLPGWFPASFGFVSDLYWIAVLTK